MEIFTIKVGINRCYVIKDEGIILIDAGSPKKIQRFREAFNRFHIHPEDIGLIVLTHGHFDHAGSARDLKTLTGAPVAIHKNDKKDVEQSRIQFPSGASPWGTFLRFMLGPFSNNAFTRFPSVKADIVLDEKDYPLIDFGVHGKIIYTPGHTPGSVSVLLETGELFAGCLAHNNIPFRFKPGLPIFAEDLEQVKESWNKVIRQGAEKVYPAHGDPFSVDVIKSKLFK